MNHIGADVHIKTIDFAVVNERGITSQRKQIETSERGIREFVRSIGKPRQIIIEEGCLASWIKEILEGEGERVIITDPKRNRWIGESEQKDDDIDAEKLGRLNYGGYTKEIAHLSGGQRRFKELVVYYHDQVKDRTRVKNKLKAKFRQNGIQCTGKTVYHERRQKSWLEKLPRGKHLQWQVEGIMKRLKFVDEQIRETKDLMQKEAKTYGEIKMFRKLPGIDIIHACTIYAIIGDIWRFSNKKKLWMYGGLGMAKKKSGGKILKKGLSKDYNRLLKRTFKMAAKSAIRQKDNAFRRQYLKLTMEQDMLPHRAELTIARSLAATIYGMWKNKTAYDPSLRIISEAA